MGLNARIVMFNDFVKCIESTIMHVRRSNSNILQTWRFEGVKMIWVSCHAKVSKVKCIFRAIDSIGERANSNVNEPFGRMAIDTTDTA